MGACAQDRHHRTAAVRRLRQRRFVWQRSPWENSRLKATVACTVVLFFVVAAAAAQTLPGTAGETLSGKRIVLAQAAQGHPAILVAAFSHGVGQRGSHWMHAIHKDPAVAAIPAYQVVSLESVPALFRGALRSMIRKNIAPAEYDSFVVLTKDEKLWRAYFGVTAEQYPYIVLLDPAGKVRWQGHGSARDLEPQLSAAAR